MDTNCQGPCLPHCYNKICKEILNTVLIAVFIIALIYIILNYLL